MKDWLIKYWLQVLFGLIISGFAAGHRRLSKKIQCKSNEQEAIKLGIQALLRDRIVQIYNNCIDKGFCPIYTIENLNALYIQYRALGGNGMVTELMEKIKDLPTERRE